MRVYNQNKGVEVMPNEIPGNEDNAPQSGTPVIQADTEPSINLQKVSKIYGTGDTQVVALNEVSLKVMPGEFIVFLGPSGSGKTTLLNLIGGLDSPSSGSIVINGKDIADLKDAGLTQFRRTQIGFVFQFFNLIPTLTARENVEFAADLVKRGMSSEELLKEVGLGERLDHFPSELSGGENQRVAIARALATDPAIILCDEPTGNLDSETGKRIFTLLRELNGTKQKTVIVVTHNALIAQIANRVVRLRDGRITEVLTNDSPKDPVELQW
jgi:putative ABC transport system ATP-binding protein